MLEHECPPQAIFLFKAVRKVFASQHDVYSTTNSAISYVSCQQELVDEAVFAAWRHCTMEAQAVFGFLTEDRPPGPRTEPPRRPKHQGSRICHDGGKHMTAWLMKHTPELDDEQLGHKAPKQYAPSCRWVLTRGVKGGAPDVKG
jgi:hypothetical protein